jgi:Ner family transcriptional regulator
MYMSNVDTPKNPAPTDWHRADIKSALEKKGLSLGRLSLKHGYARNSLSLALSTPWPKAEKLIAAALGFKPQRIWPSRYHASGAPKSGRGERGLGRYRAKNSTGRAARNVHEKAAP